MIDHQKGSRLSRLYSEKMTQNDIHRANSWLERNETGRLILTVYYHDDQLSDCNTMTVVALPAGMDDWVGE
jgi:hypothetical protein